MVGLFVLFVGILNLGGIYSGKKVGPTSITLMAAVVQLYDKHLAEFKREFSSDCEALLYVTSHYASSFFLTNYEPCKR